MMTRQRRQHDEGGHILHIPQRLRGQPGATGRNVGGMECLVRIPSQRQVVAMPRKGTIAMGLTAAHLHMAACGRQGRGPGRPDAGQDGEGGSDE
ncbi:hypothetical protein [Komagataeibacter oboediens]|uniref:hypothetical protein n=1 Tax=Komagataeibacter oboediens TaxID=65958 RepID=UPI00355644CE